MATLLHSESRRLYSWWWDSHNTPKNSKWLQDNLTDMDVKVKSMIKLIEEDADSFARRAEMYYKKRPELMKLVEEFYRAYRALAERYNHATGELRHAHKTIAAAFPDQVPLELVEEADDLFGKTSGAHSERRIMGLKQLQEMFGEKEETARTPKSNLKDKNISEGEVEGLMKALLEMQAEKEGVLVKYQECLEKLLKIERELEKAEKDLMSFSEEAGRAEIEVQTLKESLNQLVTEKNDGLIKQKEYLETIACLEAKASKFEEGMMGFERRATEAESQAHNLKGEISRLELENEAACHQYESCLGKISDLENVISVAEDNAALLKKRAEGAETEVSELKRAISDMKIEKEASAFQYKCCLETISKLETELSNAKLEVERLENEVSIGSAKIKNSEEKCTLLETSNQSLRDEANNLARKIAMKDEELSTKQEELEKLQTCLKDEHSRRGLVEATLQALQDLHSQSQDDQKALALELKNTLQMLKESEVNKNSLEEEIQKVKDENRGLSQMNESSSASMESMQNEIFSLREIKERLEQELTHHTGISISLQKEILCLKEEIEGLSGTHLALIEQVASMKSLKDENLKLRQICEEGSNEKAILLKKIEKVEEDLKEKGVVERSLSELNAELASSREDVKALQESCQTLHGEKGSLVAEKASLLSQLHAMTENMHNLLEKNAVLENSLSSAKLELEGLREKSKGLEEICELLKNERSQLLTERDSLLFKLENVERRLESLEKKITGLEGKYADLEKEKEAMHFHVERLELSLGVEKQERTNSQILSETRMAALENHIHLLQEENQWKRKESEEEIEKALKAQFEISILHKFIKDMEEKNYSLIIECQKHVEASKLAEKVISELESESLEQQVEAELLLDEIERLRLGIYQILKGLESGPHYGEEDKVGNERTFINQILEKIDDMKCSVSKHEDEKQQLLVENSVLVALLEQLESKGMEIESQKMHLEKELSNVADKLAIVENEKEDILEINEQLKSNLKAYNTLQEAYNQANQENMYLLKKYSELKEEKYVVDQLNDAVFLELLASANESVVLRSFGVEKIMEMKLLLDDLNSRCEVNSRLEMETSVLRRKLELQAAENLVLKDDVCRLEREMQEIKECNLQMNRDLINGKESLIQTEEKLFYTETKLESFEETNSALSRMVSELKLEAHESLEMRENLENKISQLSENNSLQEKEIKGLHLEKTKLLSQIGSLRQEIEENVVREKYLSMELQEMNNEFELWENEASTFCFDLQVSSIHELLLKDKVQELTGVCQILENDSAAKTLEIESMKTKFNSMDKEISGLKSKVNMYESVVDTLQDAMTHLEHNALLQFKPAHNQEPENLEDAAVSQIPIEDESLLSLRKLQTRVKAVTKMMEEMNKPMLEKRSNLNTKGDQNSTATIGDRLKSRRSFGREKFHRVKSKRAEARNSVLMKDIPLDQVSDTSLRGPHVGSDDQMLELWETTEDTSRVSCKMTEKDIVYDGFENVRRGKKYEAPSTDSDVERELGVDKLELSTRKTNPVREVNTGKILDKLAYDSKKLETFQATLSNMRRKLDTKKKGRKGKNIDFEMIDEQLLEAEDNLVQLVDLNEQLVKNVEYCPDDEMASPRMKETVRIWMTKVNDEAEKASDRVDRLQDELERIQCVLLKMEDEKKNKGKTKLLMSRTVILGDFVRNGRKNSVKRKKGPRCGCFRQSASRSGNSL